MLLASMVLPKPLTGQEALMKCLQQRAEPAEQVTLDAFLAMEEQVPLAEPGELNTYNGRRGSKGHPVHPGVLASKKSNPWFLCPSTLQHLAVHL